MRPILVALTLLTLAFAGCMSGEETPPPAASTDNSTGNVIVDENRPDPTASGNVTVGAAAAPDEAASLEKAPELKVGEWWRIKFRSPLDGTEMEFYRVMAKVDGDHYIFGMPHEGWYKEAVIYHTPAFGEVNRADLSYDTHDILFQPLQFPLTDGATWVTQFSGGPEMTATVKVVDQYVAEIEYTTTGGGFVPNPQGDGEPQVVLRATYDARVHEVVKFDHFTVQFEVVEHGYDFQGWVTVPRAEDLVFIHARVGGALGSAPGDDNVDTIEITENYNRVTFVQIVGLDAFTGQGKAQGAYRETVTGPDGTKYETQVLPTDGNYKVAFFEAKDPKGIWNIEHVAGGPGLVFTEGIAYHQYDISVPDGAIRTDHSHEVIR